VRHAKATGKQQARDAERDVSLTIVSKEGDGGFKSDRIEYHSDTRDMVKGVGGGVEVAACVHRIEFKKALRDRISEKKRSERAKRNEMKKMYEEERVGEGGAGGDVEEELEDEEFEDEDDESEEEEAEDEEEVDEDEQEKELLLMDAKQSDKLKKRNAAFLDDEAEEEDDNMENLALEEEEEAEVDNVDKVDKVKEVEEEKKEPTAKEEEEDDDEDLPDTLVLDADQREEEEEESSNRSRATTTTTGLSLNTPMSQSMAGGPRCDIHIITLYQKI
jgi:hypothetical protein